MNGQCTSVTLAQNHRTKAFTSAPEVPDGSRWKRMIAEAFSPRVTWQLIVSKLVIFLGPMYQKRGKAETSPIIEWQYIAESAKISFQGHLCLLVYCSIWVVDGNPILTLPILGFLAQKEQRYFRARIPMAFEVFTRENPDSISGELVCWAV